LPDAGSLAGFRQGRPTASRPGRACGPVQGGFFVRESRFGRPRGDARLDGTLPHDCLYYYLQAIQKIKETSEK
jgi:hypothetical protein